MLLRAYMSLPTAFYFMAALTGRNTIPGGFVGTRPRDRIPRVKSHPVTRSKCEFIFPLSAMILRPARICYRMLHNGSIDPSGCHGHRVYTSQTDGYTG
ncbi:hypothetical protein BKA93DRAFT_555345 [Sparassis latifolia]